MARHASIDAGTPLSSNRGMAFPAARTAPPHRPRQVGLMGTRTARVRGTTLKHCASRHHHRRRPHLSNKHTSAMAPSRSTGQRGAASHALLSKERFFLGPVVPPCSTTAICHFFASLSKEVVASCCQPLFLTQCAAASSAPNENNSSITPTRRLQCHCALAHHAKQLPPPLLPPLRQLVA